MLINTIFQYSYKTNTTYYEFLRFLCNFKSNTLDFTAWAPCYCIHRSFMVSFICMNWPKKKSHIFLKIINQNFKLYIIYKNKIIHY